MLLLKGLWTQVYTTMIITKPHLTQPLISMIKHRQHLLDQRLSQQRVAEPRGRRRRRHHVYSALVVVKQLKGSALPRRTVDIPQVIGERDDAEVPILADQLELTLERVDHNVAAGRFGHDGVKERVFGGEVA